MATLRNRNPPVPPQAGTTPLTPPEPPPPNNCITFSTGDYTFNLHYASVERDVAAIIERGRLIGAQMDEKAANLLRSQWRGIPHSLLYSNIDVLFPLYPLSLLGKKREGWVVLRLGIYVSKVQRIAQPVQGGVLLSYERNNQ